MPLTIAPLRNWWNARTAWEKAALAIWIAILLFVSVRVYLAPAAKTVYPIFSASGRFWWAATDLYEPGRPTTVQPGYRYSPTFAILMAPFAYFPDEVGGVLWRLFSTAALLGSLLWLARTVLPRPLTRDQLACLFLCCVPFSLQSVNNGQANILVIASLLGTVAAVKQERWNLAGILLAVAFICKLYPIALGMILVLLYPRRLGWRVPCFAMVSLWLPFLLQNPVYVLDQYESWFALLQRDDRSAIDIEQGYRDLWQLIRLYHLPIARTWYVLLQAASGAGIALLCWFRQRRGWTEKDLLTSTLALACAWMMLLGPATESSSFALLAPSFAWSVVAAWQDRTWNLRHSLLIASVIFFVLAVTLGGFSSAVKIHAFGVHSWGSLLYFVYLLSESRPSVEPSFNVEKLPLAA
jgi:alpha-1,2-mannosyltransferase